MLLVTYTTMERSQKLPSMMVERKRSEYFIDSADIAQALDDDPNMVINDVWELGEMGVLKRGYEVQHG